MLQWKRQLSHNKYSMIKILSDDDDQLLRIQSACRKDADSVNLESRSDMLSKQHSRIPSVQPQLLSFMNPVDSKNPLRRLNTPSGY